MIPPIFVFNSSCAAYVPVRRDLPGAPGGTPSTIYRGRTTPPVSGRVLGFALGSSLLAYFGRDDDIAVGQDSVSFDR